MMKKYEVELHITRTYTVKVPVEGEFSGRWAPEVEEAAKKAADNMNHDHWDYVDTEFEVFNVDEVDLD